MYTWGTYKDKDSKEFYNTGDPHTCQGHTQFTPAQVSFGSGGLGGGEKKNLVDSERAVEIACGKKF